MGRFGLYFRLTALALAVGCVILCCILFESRIAGTGSWPVALQQNVVSTPNLDDAHHPHDPDDPLSLLPAGTKSMATNGLRLELSSSRTAYVQGEDIVVVEKVSNVSDSKIIENSPLVTRDQDEMAVYAPSQRWGNLIPAPDDSKPTLVFHDEPAPLLMTIYGFENNMGRYSHYGAELEAHSSRSESHTFRIMDPGIYRFRTTWTSNHAADHQLKLWEGELVSNELYIHIRPNMELYKETKALRFSCTTDYDTYSKGAFIRVVGTLTNSGDTPVSVVESASHAGVAEFACGNMTMSPGYTEGQSFIDLKITELAAGESITVYGFETLPNRFVGKVSVVGLCRTWIKIGSQRFSHFMNANNAAEITVTDE